MSDLDLVAVVDGPVGPDRQLCVVALHQDLDGGVAAGADLGCVYVEAGRLGDPAALHPTWTHGQLVQRVLSGISRAELVRHGFSVYGRAPTALLAPMTADQIRAAARAELCGYWSWAARRPWMWLSPAIADLGLTSMARGRHAVRTGELLTKTDALEKVHAPAWLIEQLRARRRGDAIVSSRLRTGWIAWRDARTTTTAARRDGSHPAWRPRSSQPPWPASAPPSSRRSPVGTSRTGRTPMPPTARHTPAGAPEFRLAGLWRWATLRRR